MESRINYIITGAFVVVFTTGLIVFAFWLGKYSDQGEYLYYKAHMKESVSGLSNDASVKYRGVNVGTVESIKINPRNSEEINLILKIKKDTPIKQDMKVMLKFYGLTGLAFIEIEGGSNSSPLIEHKKGVIPTIEYSPSIYSNFTQSLTKIAGKLSIILDNLDVLLNKKNADNISQTLSNFNDLSQDIKSYQSEIRKLVENGVVMENKIIATSKKVADASDKMKNLLTRVDNSLQQGDYNLKELSTHTFEQIDELMYNLNVLTKEIQETVSSIKRSPSDLLFKRANPKTGPGE
ncbi:MAG TPA: MCE family protein [Gammaproteobacteria bacterium]|nr:MCE family protein [Gammaproteobacteria bacterium]